MDITDLRKEIDDVDDALIRLFSQRMDIAANIARYKHEHRLPIFVPSREQDVLKSVSEKSFPGLERYTRALYSMVFELSRAYQREQLSPLSSKIKETLEIPHDAGILTIDMSMPDETDLLFKVIAKQHIYGIKTLRLNTDPLPGNMVSFSMDIDNSPPSPHLHDFLCELKAMSESFSAIEHPTEVTP